MKRDKRQTGETRAYAIRLGAVRIVLTAAVALADAALLYAAVIQNDPRVRLALGIAAGLITLSLTVYLLVSILVLRNRAAVDDSTQRYINEIQLQKRKEQLNALQNQINPHFLYNTLDTIRGLAIERDAMDVADIVATLSAMFKYSMDYSDSVVTVGEELEHLRGFLKIQATRFPDKFTYRQIVECDENSLRRATIPKLVLQPIVENAFAHGFRRIPRGCELTLRLSDTSRSFRIVVSDNGEGIEDERVAMLNRMFNTENGEHRLRPEAEQSSIALFNINSRIRMYCGEGYGLHVDSTVGCGTDVTVTLPHVTETNP